MIVLTGMNYDEANTLYEQGKKCLKKYKRDQAATKKHNQYSNETRCRLFS